MSKKKPPKPPTQDNTPPWADDAGTLDAAAEPKLFGETQDAPALNGAAAPQKPYLVLARKYRPRTFDDLIGQEAMVKTLTNAFELGRIAQAYMLTGVRGVGKTTTARILARALNYAKPGVTAPTVAIAEPGEHCQAILESRHMDVIEMDAASNTGIDDIREIIESAKYMPAYARYKVFIIDEVHMLSKAAFNGLLKTLEEPPAHVKFIFATTEIRKVPVTVLSRCQRFDLRRVDAATLKAHFARIAEAEGQSVEDEALAVIARLAEGSVRDGLSLLDQAFSLGGGRVTAADVRAMTGLADSARIYDLLATIMRGDVRTALAEFSALYDAGADPIQLLTDLAEATHAVSRIKAAGAEATEDALSQGERERALALASRLSTPVLARAWQMLLKGIEETSRAPRTLAAAEMILIRLCYVSDLPTPGDLARSGRAEAAAQRPEPSPESARPESEHAAGSTRSAHPVPPSPPRSNPTDFASVIALAAAKRDLRMKIALEDGVSLVRFRPHHIELKLLDGAPKTIAQELTRRLQEWTGERWMVSVTEDEGERPMGEVRREEEARLKEEARRHPSVQAVFRHFPDAEITSVARIDDEHRSLAAKRGETT
ncbi:MAG: DNA polymerase III subunit gamma/tau [Hyphomicrobiales bacterium]|nr:DNA polymerase III subunit gamma/tau [Hyphomicrobiales bacterium]